MKKVFVERTCLLSAPPEQVFAWHENPANLRTITPRTVQILSLEAQPQARVGETFTLHLKHYGWPLHWQGQWQRVEPPQCLEDIALQSPFATWQQTHLFLPVEGGRGTVLTDRVECTLPPTWGWLPGAAWAVSMVLREMFRRRHAATQAYFARLTS